MKSSELYPGMMVACRDFRYGTTYKAQIIRVGMGHSKHERPSHQVKTWRPDGTEYEKNVKPQNILSQWTNDYETAHQEMKDAAEEQQIINDLKSKLAEQRLEHAQEIAHLANLLGLDADITNQWRTYTTSSGESVNDRIACVNIVNLRALEEILRPLIAQKLLGGQNP